LLGANVGRVVNDVSADLAAGATTPKDAAQAVQEAWDSEK
jgi:raffinose/stachyose/melibiose transport system substrate-binding protein